MEVAQKQAIRLSAGDTIISGGVHMKSGFTALLSAALMLGSSAASAEIIYDNLPNPMPGNVASQGYECCQVSEYGDEVSFSGTARSLTNVSVLLSDWAKFSTYSSNPAYDSAGWMATLTLNLYADDAGAPGALLATRTITPLILWRPEADGCDGAGDGYTSSVDGGCYHGLGQVVTFDFSGTVVPDDVIFGLAYNTSTYGADPIGTTGPYDSLNFGFGDDNASIGTDIDPDAAFVNSAGYGITDATAGQFSKDSGRTGENPGIRFEATTTATPEPATLALMGAGLAGFIARRRKNA